MEELIKLTNLQTGYRYRGQRRVISETISLSLKAGELTILMGPNGCGKSTLLQTISGMIPPIDGEGFIKGYPMARLTDRERSTLVSLVLTERIHTMGLSVWDIVSIGRYPHIGLSGKLHANDLQIIRKALDTCLLSHYEQREYLELSDGEKQRVMIARALAQETPIMLLDEPTAHLDLPSRIDTLRMLSKLAHNDHKGILVSTHELDLAIQWADRIWLMNKQGQLESGTPEELIRRESFERCFGRAYVDFSSRRQALNLNDSQSVAE